MLEFTLPEPDEVTGEEAQDLVARARATSEYRRLYDWMDDEYDVTAHDVTVYEAVLEMNHWETVVLFELETDEVENFYGDITIVFDGGDISGAGAWVDIFDEEGFIHRTQAINLDDGKPVVKERDWEMPDPDRLSYSGTMPKETRRYLSNQ